MSHDDEWILVEEDQSSESSNEYIEKIFRLNHQNNQDVTAKTSYSNKVAGRPLHTSRLENSSSSNNSSQDDEADDYERVKAPAPLTLELDHYTLVDVRAGHGMTIKEETEEDEEEGGDEEQDEEGAENGKLASALSNSVKWNLEDLLVKKDDQKKERRKKRKWRTTTACQKEI